MSIPSAVQNAVPLNPHNLSACLGNAVFLQALYFYNHGSLAQYLHLPAAAIQAAKESVSFEKSPFIKYFTTDAANAALATRIVDNFFVSDQHAEQDALDAVAEAATHRNMTILKDGRPVITAIRVLQIGFCQAQKTFRATIPYNPTLETNVLKSNINSNNSDAVSAGFGGTFQIVAPVPSASNIKTFDMFGLSVQSQSVRYSAFSSKSFDSLIT